MLLAWRTRSPASRSKVGHSRTIRRFPIARRTQSMASSICTKPIQRRIPLIPARLPYQRSGTRRRSKSSTTSLPRSSACSTANSKESPGRIRISIPRRCAPRSIGSTNSFMRMSTTASTAVALRAHRRRTRSPTIPCLPRSTSWRLASGASAISSIVRSRRLIGGYFRRSCVLTSPISRCSSATRSGLPITRTS